MPPPTRYLISLDARKSLHQFADVLVIGAGIAGLRAALEIPAELSVLVVTKDRITESNSTYAQGGIAGVRSPDDSFADHTQDTLSAGDGLCDRAIVEMVVREAPAQIDSLIGWGTKFDEADGQLALTKEGGHSHRRIVHALGDATGIKLLSDFSLAAYNYLIFGIVLAIMMIKRPEGLFPVESAKAEMHGIGVAAEQTGTTADSLAVNEEIIVEEEIAEEAAEAAAEAAADAGESPEEPR